MQLHDIKTLLFSEERAVSPVIGVVLMVAITVILAAVIGSFVIGLGSGQDPAPQAKFDFDYDGTDVQITHDGGDTIDGDDLRVVGSSSGDIGTVQSIELSAGDALFDPTATLPAFDSGETIRVVYEDPNSDKTATLAVSTAP